MVEFSHVNFVVQNSQVSSTWICTLFYRNMTSNSYAAFVPKYFNTIVNWQHMRIAIRGDRVVFVMFVVYLFHKILHWIFIRTDIWVHTTLVAMCAVKVLCPRVYWTRLTEINMWGFVVLSTQHPLFAKVGTNFADKWQSLGRYSSLVD
jgi:hypothetical protein